MASAELCASEVGNGAVGVVVGAIGQSEVVPGIDLELRRRCITIVNHVEAIKTFQQGIRGRIESILPRQISDK